jgi:oxygen-independent coproporphyrinogen-3 oxidase
MEKMKHLKDNGLFDAQVPRYTSYPPANHFQSDIGRQNQVAWLSAVPENSSVSLYIHIPFCKRLCWFCACRTQGTKTMRPVDAYVEFLKKELTKVRNSLPQNIKINRLHLGGGTPTILTPVTMQSLLVSVFVAFEPTKEIEFSVEIDPTEASEALLDVLVDFGMNRASIGVQDFSQQTQDAIGRLQSVEETRKVVGYLRENGVQSLNMDLLYGLPHQTNDTFRQTLNAVADMAPDRLAIYGYAHVPWMSKRQVMIKKEDLPDNVHRYELSEIARDFFTAKGYVAIGIDHFALPSDGLSRANETECLRRNFQGYTDDNATTLIGIGASAISHFPQGYIQNAPATSAYQDRIGRDGLAGHKGYLMSKRDMLIASMVEDLMCYFKFDSESLLSDFPDETAFIQQTMVYLKQQFPSSFSICETGLTLHDFAKPLVRIVAKQIDTFASEATAHSSAI